MKHLMAMLVTSVISTSLMAQSAETGTDLASTPSGHIVALSEGTLLIRLPTNRKKIQAIEESLENPDLSDKSRERLNDMLEETRLETVQEQRAYAEAFESEYTFSDYAFFFDYDTPAVLEGWAPLYAGDLETKTEIDGDQPWYILSIGRTPDSRLDGLIILDDKLDIVPRPFPNNVITSGFAALRAWFAGDPPKQVYVRKLQKNLVRFLEKTRASSF